MTLLEFVNNSLEEKNLKFMPSESNHYGFIGNLFNTNNDQKQVTIFKETFYVNDPNFPLNEENLKLIKDIQKEYC